MALQTQFQNQVSLSFSKIQLVLRYCQFDQQKISILFKRFHLSHSCREQQVCTRIGHCRKQGPQTRRIGEDMLGSILKSKEQRPYSNAFQQRFRPSEKMETSVPSEGGFGTPRRGVHTLIFTNLQTSYVILILSFQRSGTLRHTSFRNITNDNIGFCSQVCSFLN